MDLLGSIIAKDQMLWLVCGLFYFVDNIRPFDARQFIMAEGLNGRWMPITLVYGYRFRHRPVVIPNLLLPWQAAIPMRWLIQGAFERQHLRRSRRLLHLYRRSISSLRGLSASMFVLLFVIGPALTYKYGLTYGILVALPLHVIAIMLLITLLIWNRRFWGFSWSMISRLVFECAVCPGIFVNVRRRMTLAHAPVGGDAMAYAIVYCGDEVVAGIRRKFELIVEDLRDNDELKSSDEPLIAEYRLRLMAAVPNG
jgi:hypothetical protein